MSRIYSIILSIGVFVIAIDQWTKNLALDKLAREGDTIPFLSWFSWTLVYNRGAAFGMLRNLPESIRIGFFVLLPFVVLTLLWFSYVRNFKKTDSLGPIAMGLVFGGAIGNVIDRIRFGYVIDFIDWFYPTSSGKCLPLFFQISPTECHWPVFNIADSAISCAMVLLLFHWYQQEKESRKNNQSHQPNNQSHQPKNQSRK